MATARRIPASATREPIRREPAMANRRGQPGARDASHDDELFTPPSQPDHWREHDASVAEYLVLHRQSGPPLFGGESCHCGGRWRYILAGSSDHPIWRCLHCGRLHRDRRRLE